ncbi:MAG: S8 family serine peptidase [Calditrichaeota bacterium]|nr:S8 family serine peptidase [Calditrichota bacterium]
MSNAFRLINCIFVLLLAQTLAARDGAVAYNGRESGGGRDADALNGPVQAAPSPGTVDPLPDRILVKLSPATEGSMGRDPGRAGVFGLADVDAVLARYDVREIRRTFPHLKQPPTRPVPDLSRIYTLYLWPGTDADALVQSLNRSSYVEYAERMYPAFTDDVPNDPRLVNQKHFDRIAMQAAWDIEQGDSSVVVAIIDTGVDWLHEDLNANIWVNADEIPDNELDDDGNGYVDDIRGWDFVDVPEDWEEQYQPAEGEDGVEPDYDPMDFDGHGTHCAGIASAVTNNDTGIAGTGWNTTIMPVRAGYLTRYGNGVVAWGYKGIVYAANNGADIVSLSWGGGNYSQIEQESIDYAWGLGVVIIAAAGNDGSSAQHYPAAYDHVVAVGATEWHNDELASFSNYGSWVDICAPGVRIYSTLPDTSTVSRSYDVGQGTSMSAPMVAGAAALVRAHFPDSSNHEIVMKLAAGADNIDSVNADKAGLMGYGRLNVYQALTTLAPTVPNLHLTPIVSDELGNDDQIIDAGETIWLTLRLENRFMGGPATNVTASLAVDDYAITLQDPVVFIGDIQPLDTLTIQDDWFAFAVEATSIPHRAVFTVTLAGDNDYQDTLTLALTIGKASILLVDDDDGANNVEHFYFESLDSLGMSYVYWSYMDQGSPTDLSQYGTLIWLCEWSFPSLDEVDRATIGSFLAGGGNLFLSGQDIGWDLCDPGSDINEYFDSGGDSKSWYETYLHSRYLADDATPNNEPFILMTGIAGNPIGDGLSFEISQPGRSAEYQFPSVIDTLPGAEAVFLYPTGEIGAALWSGTSRVVYFAYGYEAITDPATRLAVMDRTLKWLNDFSIEHEPLTNTRDTTNARVVTVQVQTTTTTVDSMAIYWSLDGKVPFNIEAMTVADTGTYVGTIPAQGNDTEVHYFIYAMADDGFFQTSPPGAPLTTHTYIHSDTVLAVAELADGLPRRYALKQNYPNPFNPTTVIEYHLPGANEVTLDIYNLRGQLVKRLVDGEQPAGVHTVTFDSGGLASGIYFYRLQTAGFTRTRKMLILK